MENLLEFANCKQVKKTLIEWSKENIKQKEDKLKKQIQDVLYVHETNKHRGIHVALPQEPYRELYL